MFLCHFWSSSKSWIQLGYLGSWAHSLALVLAVLVRLPTYHWREATSSFLMSSGGHHGQMSPKHSVCVCMCVGGGGGQKVMNVRQPKGRTILRLGLAGKFRFLSGVILIEVIFILLKNVPVWRINYGVTK